MGLSVYVLVAILKKQLGLDLSLHQIPQILSVTVFEKTLNSRGVFQLQRRDHRYRALHPVESIRLLMGQHCQFIWNLAFFADRTGQLRILLTPKFFNGGLAQYLSPLYATGSKKPGLQIKA